jgi:Uma2 family endonuclease
MSSELKQTMTTDEFLAWAEGRDGRWELHDAAPLALSPERLGHTMAKGETQLALGAAIKRTGLPCRIYPSGVAVRIDFHNAYLPDALVVCGRFPAPSDMEIANPLIIVEVLSPSTAAFDHGRKLSGYFSLPSVMHYLILDPERRVVIHHRRGTGEALETRIHADGEIRLDPPGLVVATEALFPAP